MCILDLPLPGWQTWNSPSRGCSATNHRTAAHERSWLATSDRRKARCRTWVGLQEVGYTSAVALQRGFVISPCFAMCPLYPGPYLGKLLLASLNDTEVGAWHITFILLYRLPLIAAWHMFVAGLVDGRVISEWNPTWETLRRISTF